MKNSLILFVLCIFISGCGVLPGGGRFYSDYNNVENYAIIGANRTKVRYDFGKPDVINDINGTIEQWIYYKRQDGKTFTFDFNPQGQLVSTNIAEAQ